MNESSGRHAEHWHLKICMSVDLGLVDYLLRSSVATLSSLAVTFSDPPRSSKDPETYLSNFSPAYFYYYGGVLTFFFRTVGRVNRSAAKAILIDTCDFTP